MTLSSFLTQHLLFSFAKQFYLNDLVGSFAWHFDVRTGILSFGKDLYWHAEILGTESNGNNTWLWAWANTASNLPPSLTQASLELKQLGEQQKIPELTEPQFSLSDEVNGHALSMIASGVCDANAYYRGPYQGGAAFLLIKDEKFPRSKEHPLSRIATIFPQAISAFSIPDHRLALTSYLTGCNVAFVKQERSVVVTEGTETVLTATFDEQNRLTQLDVKLKGDK